MIRSTGLSVIFGFQTFASISKGLGDKATADLLAQLTNKVVLANSDPETTKWVSDNSGKTKRLGAHKEDEYENIWQSFAQDGEPSTPDEIDEMIENDPQVMNAKNIPLSYDAHNPLANIKQMSPYSGLSEVDELIKKAGKGSFDLFGGLAGGQLASSGSGEGTVASMKIARAYRQEDKAETYMTTGNEDQNIVEPSQVRELIEGSAWATWSAGGVIRTDFIKLDQAMY
jgi:type IV secretory pathway TraG/TraD family ATPase VirD4